MKRSILFSFLIIALLLSGCGGTATQAPPAEQPAAAEKPAAQEPVAQQPAVEEKPAAEQQQPASGEKITLRLWSHQGPAFQAANEALIARFMEQNPNIEVKYETFEYDTYIQNLQTSMSAGTEADVIEMFGTWVCSYAKGGRLQEVPANLMTIDKAKEIYFDAPLGGYTCDGKLYGFPHEFNLEVGGALVNPEIFTAHDVAFPPKWNTFVDLVADAKKLAEVDSNGAMTKAGFYYTSQDGLAFALLSGILELGGSYFADDKRHFTFDTPEARQTLQLLVDMAQKDKVVDPVVFNDKTSTNGVTELFFSGQVAIGFVGSWAAGEGKENFPDMKFDYVQVPPYFGDQYKYGADSGWGKVVSVNTKYPAEAWKLASFMATDVDNALVWNTKSGTIPAMKSLVEKPTILEQLPWLKPTFNVLPYGVYFGDLTDRDKLFYDIIFTHALSAIQGNISVDEAIKNINTEANAMVDEAQ